jgi:hypothetical protein
MSKLTLFFDVDASSRPAIARGWKSAGAGATIYCAI